MARFCGHCKWDGVVGDRCERCGRGDGLARELPEPLGHGDGSVCRVCGVVFAETEGGTCRFCRWSGAGAHGKRDAYTVNTGRMAEALAALGWGASLAYLAGGCWGVVVRTDDDESDVLVAQQMDSLGAGWVVQPDCQSHPAYGDALVVPWESWGTLPGAVSSAVYAVAKWGPHRCPYCADADA